MYGDADDNGPAPFPAKTTQSLTRGRAARKEPA